MARAVKGGNSTALSPASEIFLLPLTQPALTRPSTCARTTQGFKGFGSWRDLLVALHPAGLDAPLDLCAQGHRSYGGLGSGWIFLLPLTQAGLDAPLNLSAQRCGAVSCGSS